MTGVTFKVGDTRTLHATLSDEDGIVNLSGLTVVLRLRLRSKVGGVVVQKPATIVSEIDGTVSCELVPADITAAGQYYVEWVATGVDGDVTFPSAGYGVITVEARL